VVSLNSAREIEELAGLGYNVEFLQVSASRPSIRDFLTSIRSSGSAVAGITNADVFVAASPEWAAAVQTRSASGMILVERINIDHLRLRPTGQCCNGFDAFIFSTEPLADIDLDCEFLFGQPWWDYWFPLSYAATGGRLMKTDAPVLFHLDHPQSWSQRQWLANGRKAVRHFLGRPGGLPDDVVARIHRLSRYATIPETELGPFSHWCFSRLRAIADPIPVAPTPGNAHLLPALFGQFDNAEVRELVGELNEARGWVAGLAPSGAAAPQGELYSAILSTSSWAKDRDREISDGAFQALSGRLQDDIRYFSTVVHGSTVVDDEDLAQVLAEGFYTLTSRRASLRHFLVLNAAWIGKKYEVVREAFRRWTPWNTPTEAIDRRLLKLADQEGAKYLAAVDHMINKVAESGGRKRVGDYIVAFLQKKPEGTYDSSQGKPRWVEPGPGSFRIEIAVLDAIDKRFVPELKIRAKLTDVSGGLVADFDVPFVWDPALLHYGTEINLPAGGRHDLVVAIDPPSFVRHGRTARTRYANRVETRFEGLRIGMQPSAAWNPTTKSR